MEFNIPERANEPESGNSQFTSMSESMDSVRRRLPKVEPGIAKDNGGGSTPDGIHSELQNLRKKYDAVVEYTVHLTAERDFHFSQLEELKKELTREKALKKAPPTKGGKTAERSVDKKGGAQGYSLLVLIILALVAFFIGRYSSS